MTYCLSFMIKLFAAMWMLSGLPCTAQPVSLPTTEVSGKLIRDPDWMPYRDALRAIDTFERYDKPRNLVRPLYQLVPKREEDFSYEGLTFAIEDDDQLLPLRHWRGVAEIPLHPPVNERKARFVANRPKGTLTLNYTLSMAIREDQRYDASYLREACEQAYDLYRSQTLLNQLLEAGKRCVGVRIVLLTDDATVVQRSDDGQESVLPVAQRRFDREATVRWTDLQQPIEVRPPNRPHVLAFLTE